MNKYEIIDEIKKNGNTNFITDSGFKNNIQIHAIGDSHAIFWHNSLKIYEHWGYDKIPITMFKFIESDLNLYDIGKLLGNGHEKYPIKQNDIVLFCYGYNDFQRRIIEKSSTENINNDIKIILQKYIETINKMKNKYNIIPIINCIYPNHLSYAKNINSINTPEFRKNINEYGNNYLRKLCIQNNIEFFDIYDFISDENGFIKNEYTFDGIHLDYNNEYLRNVIDNMLIDKCIKYS